MELWGEENRMSQDPKDRAKIIHKISEALKNVEKEKPSSMLVL
jgi:hypothetical protein